MKKTWISLALACALSCTGLLTVQAHPATGQMTSGYTQTRYPIVLVHGLFGFDNIGPIEMFYGIPRALRKDGANVHVAQVAAANSTEVRGEQLLAQVKQILAATGASKVNLMGHSHGGPTVRYVASVRPDLVASVTSIAGVHKGAPMADSILAMFPLGTPLNTVVAGLADIAARFLGIASGEPWQAQNTLAAAQSLSTAGSLKFNQAHPWGVPATACGEGAYAERGVAYYSWSVGQPFTNPLDLNDFRMALSALAFKGVPNDGQVSTCSSHLGKVIRDNYKMNHLDEVNQIMGLVSWTETNPVTVFRQHANRLKNAGM
jgi:triacylglycerol lipase